MPSRLILALALSLALHASLLLPEALQRSTPPAPPTLQATLRLPDKPPIATIASDQALLKNTLESAKATVVASPPRPPPGVAHSSQPRVVPQREAAAAQRKLAEHLYYPPEAIARGIEGEVRLILTVGENGQITDVNVASSSGHAILDKAAVKAAWAMGKVNWAHSRDLILLVPFRLVD